MVFHGHSRTQSLQQRTHLRTYAAELLMMSGGKAVENSLATLGEADMDASPISHGVFPDDEL
jgi:hypothetical protein